MDVVLGCRPSLDASDHLSCPVEWGNTVQLVSFFLALLIRGGIV